MRWFDAAVAVARHGKDSLTLAYFWLREKTTTAAMATTIARIHPPNIQPEPMPENQLPIYSFIMFVLPKWVRYAPHGPRVCTLPRKGPA